MSEYRYHSKLGHPPESGSRVLDVFLKKLPKWVVEIDQIVTTITPALVAANTTAEQTFTIVGVASTDQVRAVKPSHTAGIVLGNCRVTAKDTVAITFGNLTAGGITPPSEAYIFVVEKIKGA